MRLRLALFALTVIPSMAMAQIKVIGPEVGTVNNQYLVKVDEYKGTDLKIKYLKDGQEQKSSMDFIQLKDNDNKPVIVVFTRNPGTYNFIFATAGEGSHVDLYVHTLKITGNPNVDPIIPIKPIVSNYETKLTTALGNKPIEDVQGLLRAWQKTEPKNYVNNLSFLTALKSNTEAELNTKLRELRDIIGTYMKEKYPNGSTYDLDSLTKDWELTSKIIKQSLGQN